MCGTDALSLAGMIIEFGLAAAACLSLWACVDSLYTAHTQKLGRFWSITCCR